MEGRRGDQLSIKVSDPDYRKIEAIKEIRHLSGMGLKEAKDAVEDAVWKEVSIPLSHEMLKEENQYKIDAAIATLERCGITVF